MLWNTHSNIKDQHAFLSASKYHWINYDEDKLDSVYNSWQAAQRGTELHDLASKLIKLGVKLPRSNKAINLYVNDAIGFKMKTEQPLFYSFNCFGTADAISFRNKVLRIHDLKTGRSPASIKQLLIYAALFCLEYVIDPSDIEIDLRIYQFDEPYIYIPQPEEIKLIMGIIIAFDKRIENLKQGE